MSEPAIPPTPPAPQTPPFPPPAYRAPTNGMAVASMVLGILGLLGLVWIISPILALVFGYSAKGQIDRAGGTQEGRGMAIAGIVLGWVGIAWSILILVWMWWAFTNLFPPLLERLPETFPSISPIPAPQ